METLGRLRAAFVTDALRAGCAVGNIDGMPPDTVAVGNGRTVVVMGPGAFVRTPQGDVMTMDAARMVLGIECSGELPN